MGYSDELGKFAGEVPWLTYIPTVSRPWEDNKWIGETGRVDDLIRKYTDLWELTPKDTKVYLCGHPEMIENTRGIVRRRGWQETAIQAEAYFVPRATTTPLSRKNDTELKLKGESRAVDYQRSCLK